MSTFENSILFERFSDILPTLTANQVQEMNRLYQENDLDALYWLMNYLSSTPSRSHDINVTYIIPTIKKIEVRYGQDLYPDKNKA